jgi:hypothetical protein
MSREAKYCLKMSDTFLPLEIDFVFSQTTFFWRWLCFASQQCQAGQKPLWINVEETSARRTREGSREGAGNGRSSWRNDLPGGNL